MQVRFLLRTPETSSSVERPVRDREVESSILSSPTYAKSPPTATKVVTRDKISNVECLMSNFSFEIIFEAILYLNHAQKLMSIGQFDILSNFYTTICKVN